MFLSLLVVFYGSQSQKYLIKQQEQLHSTVLMLTAQMLSLRTECSSDATMPRSQTRLKLNNIMRLQMVQELLVDLLPQCFQRQGKMTMGPQQFAHESSPPLKRVGTAAGFQSCGSMPSLKQDIKNTGDKCLNKSYLQGIYHFRTVCDNKTITFNNSGQVQGHVFVFHCSACIPKSFNDQDHWLSFAA